MRFEHLKDDIQLLIYKLIDSISSNPVAACNVKFGWPDFEVNKKFEKPVIYILSPLIISKDFHFGGQNKINLSLIIGCWNDRNTGGSARCDQIISYLYNFFDNKQTCHNATFTVTLGTTTYTNTTLSAQDCYIDDVTDDMEIQTDEINEFRKEIKLYLETF